MQHLDGTSETIATTLCLWIGGGVVSNSSLFSSKPVLARRDVASIPALFLWLS
jgi:hypothetical protein